MSRGVGRRFGVTGLRLGQHDAVAEGQRIELDGQPGALVWEGSANPRPDVGLATAAFLDGVGDQGRFAHGLSFLLVKPRNGASMRFGLGRTRVNGGRRDPERKAVCAR